MSKLPYCKLELDPHEQKQFYAFLVKVWLDTELPGMKELKNPSYLSAAVMDRYFAPATVAKIKGGLHSGKFKLGLPECIALFQLINQYDLTMLNEYEPMMGKLVREVHPFLQQHTGNQNTRIFQNVEVVPHFT